MLAKEFKMESITKNSSNVIGDKFYKEFYGNVNIFDGCKTLLQEMKDDLIEYETDGLIFHPINGRCWNRNIRIIWWKNYTTSYGCHLINGNHLNLIQ